MKWEFTQRSRMGLILHYHVWLQKGAVLSFCIRCSALGTAVLAKERDRRDTESDEPDDIP